MARVGGDLCDELIVRLDRANDGMGGRAAYLIDERTSGCIFVPDKFRPGQGTACRSPDRHDGIVVPCMHHWRFIARMGQHRGGPGLADILVREGKASHMFPAAHHRSQALHDRGRGWSEWDKGRGVAQPNETRTKPPHQQSSSLQLSNNAKRPRSPTNNSMT